MKYEAVFGDYKFSSPACEVAMQSSFGEIIEMRFTKPLVIPEGWGVIAMRRIIAEPNRWTVADQKAGRLPEVGCKVDTFIGECMIIGADLNLKHVAVQYHDGYMDILHISKIKPIETPEEKAARLREEWCAKAVGVCGLGMLGITTLTRIYDALLSGDLPAPGKE